MARNAEGFHVMQVLIVKDEYEKFKAIASKIPGLTFKEFVNEAVKNFNGQFEKYLKAEKPINIIDLMRADIGQINGEINEVEKIFKEKLKEPKNDSSDV